MTKYLQSYDKNRKRIGILSDAYDVQRRRRINSDYTLSFFVPMSGASYRDKLPLKGHVMDERGQYYVINSKQRVRDGRKLTAAIECSHVMFKLADYKVPYASYIKESYGAHIKTLTDVISAATGGRFTFSIDDTFPLYDVKDWGRTNCLAALNDVLKMYGAEVEPDNFVIHLRKKIGADNGLQYRIRKNVVSSTFKDDSGSLCTRLYAQMKDGRTWIGQPASILTAEERALLSAMPGAIVNGILQVNYLISPRAAEWASDSVPFYDDEIIEQDVTDPLKLLEVARKALKEREVPLLEITVNAADVFKLDKTEPKPGLGDVVKCVDPEMEMTDIDARITELTEYPYAMDKHAQVTIANVMRRDYADIIANLEDSRRTIEQYFSGGQIRTDVFESAAKQAITDINNSKTEIVWPEEGGLLAREKTNPLRQVRLTAAGLGVSTDGWKTIRAAITADGVIAERITGQLGNFVSLLIGSGNNVVQINTNGIAAGHATFSSAPFQVKMNGDVIARSIKLTGQIDNSSMYSSDITGGTITGALLRTAASGDRIEINSAGLKA
ncbi:phage tail protein, partial [Paenibacillus motobuensis]|uniref:phage tail protein n=1 Tax=Paenibacillus motobuensis TaxID=295324 RepID=UPI00362A2A35